MIKKICLGIIAGFWCTSFTISEAKPLKKAPALTGTEAYCHAWGNMAFQIAVSRDKDVSLAVILDTVRREFAILGPAIQQLAVDLTYQIYSTDAPPSKVQRYFETGCILHGAKY